MPTISRFQLPISTSVSQAGFTFFTIDPGEHVDNRAKSANNGTLLRELAEKLPAEVQPKESGLLGKRVSAMRKSLTPL